MISQRESGKLTLVLALLWVLGGVLPAWGQSTTKVWEEPLTLPTYEIGPPAADPIFYAGRTYQGAKGKIYPYPLYDEILDKRVDKKYQATYLENRYVKICILPELGGRIFSALDKTNNYDYVYRQTEIRPALIGMLGAWISGGVEWNIPHHHRPSTYNMVDYRFVRNADGSSTVWVGEIELRHRLKWLVGLTIYPDKSYIAITTKLLNRTPLAHSFLAFTNLAVHANPDYQVVFPPDTHFATQHGKVEFSGWPISHEFYGGVDYTAGVDISWWKNHPSPVSFFAWDFDGDFFGGYDHGRHAGIVSVQDHHVSPGAKFFEWGNGPEGEMLDKILDSAGPYLELMSGNFSDNQPDYSWEQPYEAKTATQYWYPVRDIGAPKNANLNGAVNLTVDEQGKAHIGFYATQEFIGARVRLQTGGRTLFEETVTVAPDRSWVKEVALPADVKEQNLKVSVLSAGGRELISYQPTPVSDAAMPPPATPPPPPREIKTVEELYLAGLRLEQFHSPAMEPYPFYEEALRRDPGNYLVNTALGRLYCERGLWEKAQQHLETAVARAAHNHTRPKDGEAYYYLGVALRAQEKDAAAEDNFNRAAWSLGWTAASYYQAAELACRRADWPRALDYLARALLANTENPRVWNLKATVLRQLGREQEAAQAAAQALTIDPLDLWAAREASLAGAGSAGAALPFAVGDPLQSNFELAVDYSNAGFLAEARKVFGKIVSAATDPQQVNALVYYYLGYLAGKQQQPEIAVKYYRLANEMPVAHVFPLRLESVPVLEAALRANPRDARAPYYLGTLLFDLQPEAAIQWWEKSVALDGSLAVVQRNLAQGYELTENNPAKAIANMEKAVALDRKNPRYYVELDKLYEAGNVPPEKRLAALEANPTVVAERTDGLTQQAKVLILLGRYDQALELMRGREFHNWEGESAVHDVYMDACLLRGREQSRAGKHQQALQDYTSSLDYPANLEVGRPYRQYRAAEVLWLKGSAYAALGEASKARVSFQQAQAAPNKLPEMLYYQGLAAQKLGRTADATRLFSELIKLGQAKLASGAEVDYFAKFGGRQSPRDRAADAHYLLGLGNLGQGNTAKARGEFEAVLKANINHLGARTQLAGM